ncbi:Mu transposase C-terminal domain-containing protein [Pseudoduganella aquatica]|uniref:Mu transposase C-terminal domain-containing protein n=1 Tax=Pseudoduganella aquatica TaxID=2660641 RepID=UPI001E59EB25|nr:Mu transposase C-terminal domain-containing protein [Pseudoduganella aquatica]
MNTPMLDRFDRRKLMMAAPPVELWPSIDSSHLEPTEQGRVQQLCSALWDLFSEGDMSVKAIMIRYGVQKQALYRAARRCIEKHPDGGIYGFRAVLPYMRTKDYERQIPPTPVPYERTGCTGALAQLFRDYPDIEKCIRTAVRNRSRPVKPGGQVRQPIQAIHRDFIKSCRDAGITADKYPLNTSRMGIRSLHSYIKRVMEKDFDMAVSHAGGTRSSKAPSEREQAPAATRPFEVVEFDGHKMDIRLTVRMVDPFGMEQILQLHRIWILVLLDVYTRAVIGYHIALGKEYNKDDVAAALQASLSPAQPRHYIIPELMVSEGGGLPSAVLPELAFACWDWFRMDGAKSHRAGDTLIRLNQIVGCWTDNGPPATPNDRPYIERFFHVVAKHFAHRLPGTVGSSPDSIEKALSDPKGDLSLSVELPELEDMIHVLISNYNGNPHPGVGGKTPLEALAYSLRSKNSFIRTLPMPIRSNLCLMQEARVVPIKGSARDGVRPHINFAHVRYTAPVLASNAALINRKLRIYYDVRDMRAVKAFFEDGTELGVLTAARPWNITPHSLRLRQEIHRLIAEGKLKMTADECPVTAWSRFKWRTAKKDKKSANALAKAQENAASVEQSPPAWHGENGAHTQTAPSSGLNDEPPPAGLSSQPDGPPPPEAPPDPPKPKSLQVRRVVTF